MKQRLQSLDAMRGLAIILMVLSGIVPYKTLPAWMYHAQIPPPDRIFDPALAGLTWVDLVFPFFLFAMGTAIPFSLNSRLKNAASRYAVIPHLLERFFLLVIFAIFVRHMRPYVIDPGMWSKPFDALLWGRTLLGFAVLFLLYLRYPAQIPVRYHLPLRIFSWIAAAAYLFLLGFPDGSGFDPNRMDIILMLLANMALFAGLIWIFTADNLNARFVIMALFIAIRLLTTQNAFIHILPDTAELGSLPNELEFIRGYERNHWLMWIWQASPAGWLYQFSWLKYLLIVLPGTIVGDMIYRFIKREKIEDSGSIFPIEKRLSSAILSFGGPLFIIYCLFSFQGRWGVAADLASIAFVFLMWRSIPSPNTDIRRLIKDLQSLAMAFYLIGLFLEPFEGGIRKDPATLSYFFINSALAIYLLISLFVNLDMKAYSNSLVRTVIDNGKNPMIAYVASANLIWPLLYALHIYPGLKTALGPYPWLGFLLALAETYLLMRIVQGFTMKKLYWRT